MDNDQPAQPEQESKSDQPKPKLMPIAIGTLLVIFLLFLQTLVAARETRIVRERSFAQGVDAVAASLRGPMLENDKFKLNQLCTSIATQAGYQEVTIFDLNGVVKASTNTTLRETKVKMPDRAFLKATVETGGGFMTSYRTIILAGTTYMGTVRISAAVNLP